MMKRVCFYLFSALLIIFISSCSSTRSMKKGVSIGNLSESEYMEELISRSPGWDAITAKFGSGCSSIFSEATLENSKNGKRTFIGLFDPSVRRYIHENILSFTIPMSRFREMYYTIQDSCLSNTPAWGKIRERICRE